MEQNGTAAATRYRRSPPSADRFLGTFQAQSSAATPPLELSEHDIFSSSSSSSSPSNLNANPSLIPTVDAQNHVQKNHGILAALNDSSKARSGSSSKPVFNHKASASVSLSSSSSTSPSTSFSSRMMIPKRPPPPPSQVDRMRLYHQSAPVRVPVIPEALRKKVMEFEGVLLEEEEEEGEEVEGNGVILPPHEVVAARHSPILACSVMEGAGRTLKGRDLRQRITRPAGGINELLHWLPVSLHKKLYYIICQIYGLSKILIARRGKKIAHPPMVNGCGMGLSSVLEADVKNIVRMAKETFERFSIQDPIGQV